MSRQIDVSNPESLSDADKKYLRDRGRIDTMMVLDYMARQQAAAAAALNNGNSSTDTQEVPVVEEVDEPYEKWTVDELRDELNARNLSDDGKKAELVARLEADDKS